MTRENKLALVLGFGLLLLAGILVSDYLSAGNRVHEDPLIATNPSHIPDSEILKPANQVPSKRSAQRPRTAQDPKSEPLREIRMGAPREKTQPGEQTSTDLDVHIVDKGESLGIISKRYYGTPNYADEIARFNNLSDPDRVKLGTRLVLPRKFAGKTAPSTRPEAQSSPIMITKRNKTVEVREGETLSDIAKRELGDGNKWRALWLANKNVVPNPDRLSPGTVLQLPTT